MYVLAHHFTENDSQIAYYLPLVTYLQRPVVKYYQVFFEFSFISFLLSFNVQSYASELLWHFYFIFPSVSSCICLK